MGGTQDAQQRGEVTFEKPEPLEEVCADKGVAEIEKESTEENPFTVDIDWVWARADVAYGHLEHKGERNAFCLRNV